jgi:hypothetical protein
VRALSELDRLPVSDWTEEEARAHLAATFDIAVREFPDAMEPYVVLLADCDDAAVVEIMRRGLRETVKFRYSAALRAL